MHMRFTLLGACSGLYQSQAQAFLALSHPSPHPHPTTSSAEAVATLVSAQRIQMRPQTRGRRVRQPLRLTTGGTLRLQRPAPSGPSGASRSEPRH